MRPIVRGVGLVSGRQDTAIPREVLVRARAVATARGSRASHGRWSPPALLTVGGGSVGLLLGGQVIER
jgi:lipid-binding SYLF domain-containing protein